MSGDDAIPVGPRPGDESHHAVSAARRLLEAMEAEPIPDHLRELAEELAEALLRAGAR